MIKNKINVLFVCISIIYFLFSIFISEKLSFLIVDNKVFDSYNPDSYFLNNGAKEAEFNIKIASENLVNLHFFFISDFDSDEFDVNIVKNSKIVSCNYSVHKNNDKIKYLKLNIYPSIVGMKDSYLSINIKSLDNVSFLYSDEECKEPEYKQYGYISKKTQSILFCLCFFACIVFYLFIFYFIYKGIKPHFLYLFLAIIFGVITIFIQAPLAQPDAITHYESIYSFSNRILGLKTKDGYILKRNCDLHFLPDYYDDGYVVRNHTWSGDVKHFFMSINDNLPNAKDLSLIEVPKWKIIVSPRLEYVPQVLLMTLGRLIGLNQFLLYFLVLLGNYGLMIFLIYNAIKISGDNYLVFFYLGLNPMILRIIQSVSYDAIVYSLSLLVIAYVYKFFVMKNITKKDYICSSICSLLLFPMKGIYFPISFLIPISIALKNINKIVITKKIIISIISFFILFVIFMIIKFDVKTSNYYSINFIFHHPVQSFMVFSRTLFLGTDWYSFSETFLNNYKFNIILLIFIILFKVENRLASKQVLILMFTYIFISILLFIVAFTWTRCGSRELLGLQSRYFYPILPLFILSVQKFSQDRILLNKKYGLLIISLCYFAWLLMEIRF